MRFCYHLLIFGVGMAGTLGHCQFANCTRNTLPPPGGDTITVSTTGELESAVSDANNNGGNLTILLEDGTYWLTSLLHVTADNITVRSLSGDRHLVSIFGQGMTGAIPHVFLVGASYFICADLTLGRIANHGIQIQGENDADYPLIHNVHFEDTGEQMLKVSYGGGTTGSDGGIVEWCTFEYTAGIGPQYYIGGIDAHHATNWTVRYNTFQAIRSPDGNLAEHAIHFWSFSEQTSVHHNQIIDCDRGIGFGLGTSGHIGGSIINNMVHTTRDIGIGLETADHVEVLNNTVFTENYFNSIEYRFLETTGGSIKNNLTNMAIASRNGGSADVETNVEYAEAFWFSDATGGDLHLSGSRPEVVDQAMTLIQVSEDFDCENRPQGSNPDIGADEFLILSLTEICPFWLDPQATLCGTPAPNILGLIDYLNAGGCQAFFN